MKFIMFFIALVSSTFAIAQPQPKVLFGTIRHVVVEPTGTLISLRESPCIEKSLTSILTDYKQGIMLDSSRRLLINGCWKDLGNYYQIVWEDGAIMIKDKKFFNDYSEYYRK